MTMIVLDIQAVFFNEADDLLKKHASYNIYEVTSWNIGIIDFK